MALLQVKEESDSWYSASLTDQDDTAMVQGDVATLTLTIYEKIAEGIVNSRNQFDLRNADAWDQGCTISDPEGVLTLRLTPADNEVTNANNNGRPEIHVLVFEGTTVGSPSYAFKHVYEYEIQNLVKTPLIVGDEIQLIWNTLA